MLKKILVATSILILFSILLSACIPFNETQTDTSITDTTTSSPTAQDETTLYVDLTTANPEDTTEYNSKIAVVPFADLNIEPISIKNSNNGAVNVGYTENSLTISSVGNGSSLITLTNKYGEQAYVNATTNNDLNLITTLTPKLIPQNSVIVTDYGAKGNGSTDDTTAIQNAINDMAGKGTVYIPEGIYLISYLALREGTTLRLAGYLEDATVGYNSATSTYVKSGKVAIIRSSLSSGHCFYNLDKYGYCTEGKSNIVFTGGVIDCQEKVLAFVLACGDNINISNCIVKDIPNNHAIQITGSTNVTVENVMFAGYTYSGTNTRETIQIEVSTPGAISSDYANSPARCDAGDFHYCKNIKVLGCYFGKSDESGSQLTAVGHHSTNGESTCDGFSFIGNVVDNPLYCGLHIINYNNITIKDNTFISESSPTTAISSDSALISLYCSTSNLSYVNSVANKTINYCSKYEQDGIHNVDISNNEFILGDTVLRVFSSLGTGYSDGQTLVSNQTRCDAYNSATTYTFSGVVAITNIIKDVQMHDNEITYKCAPTYSDYCIYVKSSINVTVNNNALYLPNGFNFNSDLGIKRS